MEPTNDTVQLDERKLYTKPEILHELELETRAGSKVGPIINPLDN
jgi:hypothetical protein